MPTDNPKISAYVPQVVYDRFEQLRKESDGLSMSQLATIIFAKHFGLEDIVKEITKETTVDNSALDRIKSLESQVGGLLQKFSELESRLLGNPSSELKSDGLNTNHFVPDEKSSSDVANGIQVNDSTNDLPIFNLSSEPLNSSLIQISPIMGKVLVKRLISPKTGKSISQGELSQNNKTSPDVFLVWTKELDIDGIGWEFKGRSTGYAPMGGLSDELQSKLLNWIRDNS